MSKPEDDLYRSLQNQEELLYEQNYNQTTSLLAQEAIHRQQEENNRLQAEQNEQLRKLTAQNADLQRRLNEQNANLQRQLEQQRQQMLDQQRQMFDRETMAVPDMASQCGRRGLRDGLAPPGTAGPRPHRKLFGTDGARLRLGSRHHKPRLQ